MKYALVTGATSGIGREVVLKLHSLGWYVGMIDLQAEQLEQLQSELNNSRTWIKPVDVTEDETLNAAYAEFAEVSGQQLDLLFNSAGILSIGSFESIDLTRHHAILDINVKGVLNSCYAAFPYLKQTAGSHVVNMSSASAMYGVPKLASYSASKFAVRGLTEGLDLEWEVHDIKVSDLMPPFVNTPMLSTQQEGAPVLDRMGVDLEASDVADALIELLNKPMTHKPVSWSFKLLYNLSSITHPALNRLVMKFLSR